MKRFHIGCSGWSYPDWKGRFYPPGTPSGRMLETYARRFGTVEIDMTFYRLPVQSTAAGWDERTPGGFVFAAKMNRTVTHFQKLRGTEKAVASFFAALGPLDGKLGPILVQLPPSLGPDQELLDRFLGELPEGHRYVLEPRHPDWFTARTYRILERHGAALCLADRGEGLPEPVVAAPIAYVRWHGRSPSYSYPDEELRRWAEFLGSLDVEEVYGYFNNDAGARAPRNAETLIGLMKRT